MSVTHEMNDDPVKSFGRMGDGESSKRSQFQETNYGLSEFAPLWSMHVCKVR